MQTFGIILALVASACAYTVTQPNASQDWTNSGAQPVAWDRVSTDATNFTIVLTNQNRAVLPQDQVLVAEQDGVTTDNTMVNPPSGGWPTGTNFRINLVRSVSEQNTIYAQSSEFAIRAGNSTTSSPLSTRPVTGTPINTVPLTSNAPPASPTNGTDTTGNPNSAIATATNAGLMALLGFVSYVVA